MDTHSTYTNITAAYVQRHLSHTHMFTQAHAHKHIEHTFVPSHRHARVLIHTFSFTHTTHAQSHYDVQFSAST